MVSKTTNFSETIGGVIYGAVLVIIIFASLVALNNKFEQPIPGPELNPAGLSAIKPNLETGQLKDKTYTLTPAEIVEAYKMYLPEIKSPEGFMDLLEAMHKYSTMKVIKETGAEQIVASGRNLSVAMKELKIKTGLPTEKIKNIILAKTDDPTLMRFELHFYEPILTGVSYLGVISLKMNFPKDSLWSIQNMGDSWVFKNIEGRPSIKGGINLLFWKKEFVVYNIREGGKFSYLKKGQKTFLGYFIGERSNDRDYFGGIDIAPLHVRSFVSKGDNTWPLEVPSFSELHTLIAQNTPKPPVTVAKN